MFKLWVWSTCIFALQAIAGVATYHTSGSGTAAFVAAFLAAMFVFIAAAIFFGGKFYGTDREPFDVLIVATAIAAIAAAFVGPAAEFASPRSVALIVAVAFAAAAAAANAAGEIAYPAEPFLLRVLAALPAGLGTVGGGIALLFVRKR